MFELFSYWRFSNKFKYEVLKNSEFENYGPLECDVVKAGIYTDDEAYIKFLLITSV